MYVRTHRDKSTCLFNMSSKETQWGIILQRERDQSMSKLLLPSCDLCGQLAGQYSAPISIQANTLTHVKQIIVFKREEGFLVFVHTRWVCRPQSVGPLSSGRTLQWLEHVAESCHSVTNEEQRDLALTFPAPFISSMQWCCSHLGWVFPTSANSVWKLPPRHTQSCVLSVAQVTLDPAKVAVRTIPYTFI